MAIFEKEDFKGPVAQVDETTEQEATIKSAMTMMNEQESSKTSVVTEKESKVAEITEEEEELAEQMFFQGYAEKEYKIKLLKDKNLTVCTITPHEMTIVNNMIYDTIREHTDEDDNLTIPQVEITSLKNNYILALSFIGFNGEDICSKDVTSTSRIIKLAIKKLGELVAYGDIEKVETLRKDIYAKIKIRVNAIKSLPTHVIDYISDTRYEFESRMYEIMEGEAIIPK